MMDEPRDRFDWCKWEKRMDSGYKYAISKIKRKLDVSDPYVDVVAEDIATLIAENTNCRFPSTCAISLMRRLELNDADRAAILGEVEDYRNYKLQKTGKYDE